MRAPMADPQPDFDLFLDCVVNRKEPPRPLIVEFIVDYEIRRQIGEELLGQTWAATGRGERDGAELEIRNTIDFWYRMGYHFVLHQEDSGFLGKTVAAKDTAMLSRGQRNWVDQGGGSVRTWEDFERYPWPEPETFDFWRYEYYASHVPEGMGFLVCHGYGPMEIVMEKLLGYENLCLLIYDNPELVRAVFDRVGDVLVRFYAQLLDLEGVRGVIQGDDMGYKTGTFLSPEMMREYPLPIHQRLAQMAHDKGLPYFLHSCGNLTGILHDLIETVRIDAKHSFEDVIMPVTDFKRAVYPRLGVLGGVDVDKLSSLDEAGVRRYVRAIVEECMPGGGFALGSGNSVTNYIPVRNYLAMVDEALSWTP